MYTKNPVNDREMQENHRNYCARRELYGKFGYDMEKERGFIIEKAVPLYGDILEVGTGKGHFSMELASRGYMFTSIDESRENLRVALMNLQYYGFERNAAIVRENAEKLSFKDARFNAVFMINTLHHLNHPWKVLGELLRVVSLNGKLVISDFTDEGFAVMDKIHAMEGTCHDKGKASLGEIGDYLLSKGFRTERSASRFQEVMIVRFCSLASFDLFA